MINHLNYITFIKHSQYFHSPSNIFILHFKNWLSEPLSPSRLTPDGKLLQNHFSHRLLYVRPPPPTVYRPPVLPSGAFSMISLRALCAAPAMSSEETFEKNWFDWLNQVKSGNANCCVVVLIWLNALTFTSHPSIYMVDRFRFQTIYR